MPARPRDDAGCPHLDGYSIKEVDGVDDVGPTIVLVLLLVADGKVANELPVHAVRDDDAGRAELSRVRPLCAAIAAYLNFGGRADEVAWLARAFAGLGDVVLPEGHAHVLTEATTRRRHVLLRDDGAFLLVEEGHCTRVLPDRDRAVWLCAGGDDEDGEAVPPAINGEVAIASMGAGFGDRLDRATVGALLAAYPVGNPAGDNDDDEH